MSTSETTKPAPSPKVETTVRKQGEALEKLRADVDQARDHEATARAEVREQMATLEAAVSRLQELAANALRPCPCGNQRGHRSSFFVDHGTLWCDSGHMQWYGSRGE